MAGEGTLCLVRGMKSRVWKRAMRENKESLHFPYVVWLKRWINTLPYLVMRGKENENDKLLSAHLPFYPKLFLKKLNKNLN